VLTTSEAIAAHAAFLRMVREQTLTHLHQPGLTAAVALAGKRKIGKAGGWGWEPTTPDGDVSPVDAVTFAAYGATSTRKRSTGEGRSSGGNRTTSGRRAVVV